MTNAFRHCRGHDRRRKSPYRGEFGVVDMSSRSQQNPLGVSFPLAIDFPNRDPCMSKATYKDSGVDLDKYEEAMKLSLIHI